MSRALRLPRPLIAWAAALAWLLCAAGAAHAELTFPKLTGRVVDDAHVLSAQTQADLTSKLQALETQTGRQLVVVTLPSLQGDDISDYGYRLGRAWSIGQKGQNNGVVFIVAPTEHKVRVEVGYGLEPVLTDALSSGILQEQVLPRFRSGDVQGGVTAGTQALIQQLSLPDAQARQNVAQAEARPAPRRHGIGLGGLIPLIIIFVIIMSVFRRAGGSAWWLAPLIFSSRGGGGWGGGGWGGGGGGGGGFSGGGGSFGGGGASGSW